MNKNTLLLIGAAFVAYELLKSQSAAAQGMPAGNPGARVGAVVNSLYGTGYAAYRGGTYLYNVANRIF